MRPRVTPWVKLLGSSLATSCSWRWRAGTSVSTTWASRALCWRWTVRLLLQIYQLHSLTKQNILLFDHFL